jgi:hypothetical protein
MHAFTLLYNVPEGLPHKHKGDIMAQILEIKRKILFFAGMEGKHRIIL